jgi:hypothetical protein
MKSQKLYVISFLETVILGFVSLADLDIYLRIAAGFVGIALSILTGLKIYQQIMKDRIQTDILHSERRIKEEEERRFFENKYQSGQTK